LLSRYVNNRYIYPSIEKSPDSFLHWLKRIAKSNKYDVLITPEEETSLLIARHMSEISSYIRTPLVKYETIAFARNKFRLVTYALNMGISCPKTLMINTLDGAIAGLDKLSLPVVLKPIISSGGHGIRYIFSKDAFDMQYKSMCKKYKTFIMQEYIPGNESYGVSVIFNARNQMRSAFVHKKLRQCPITGGVSTCAISVKFPRLVEITEAVLHSIGWYGAANVEFKIDERDGSPKLIEINPRLWGSLQLTITSGINIPYLLYQLAMHGDIKPHFEYKTGIKFRWFMHGDFVHFLVNLIGQRKFCPDVFKLFEKRGCHATWSLSDPLPFLGLPLSLLDYLISDEMKKFRS